jgi:hypothetical protein
MADIAAVRLTNIKSVTQGSNKYIGVRSVTIRAEKGRLLPILPEGLKYPTGTENVGMPDHPVTTSIVFETDAGVMIAMLAEAVGSLVIVYAQSGGGADKTITIANHQFKGFSHSQNLQDFGKPSIEGVAHSADGSALPISSA